MNATSKASKRAMFFVYALAASLLAGCGSGGGGGGGGAAPPALQTPIGNVAGVWTITEETQTSPDPDCEPPADPLPAPYPLTVTQNGNNLTVVDGDSNTFTGTISANNITWSGSYPEGAGTTTINSLRVTVAPDCNTLSGNSTWTYVETGFQCTGSGTFRGARNIASGCSGGSAATSEIEPNNSTAAPQVVTFPATISGSTIGDFSDNVPAVDVDFYRFTLSPGQAITITLAGGTVQDIDLHLFNSSGNPITSSTGPDSNETISIGLAAGTYFVRVLPFEVTTTTSYTLSIQ